jgi:antibiotic biosynthesis monooxygenase (ABM) superfamily enzyme
VRAAAVRLLGFLFVVTIGLALFKAALVVLLLVYPLVLLWAVVVRPKETFGFLVFIVAMFLLDKHPLASLGTVVVLVVVGATAKRTCAPP